MTVLEVLQCRHLIPALMRGQPGHSTQSHARLSQFPGHWCIGDLKKWTKLWFASYPCHWCIGDLKMNLALICKLPVSLMCVAYNLACYPWSVGKNQALINIKSTSVGIKCLYCSLPCRVNAILSEIFIMYLI